LIIAAATSCWELADDNGHAFRLLIDYRQPELYLQTITTKPPWRFVVAGPHPDMADCVVFG